MQWDHGKLVKLRNRRLEAWVSPRHGGAIARLFEPDSGFQVLRETSIDDIVGGETMKFGCFPMVPYSNRIGFRRLEFDGKVFELDSNRAGTAHSFHGNAWMSEWSIDELHDDRLGISFTHSEGDGHWPFPYRAQQWFALEEGALHIRLALQNTGTTAFPAGAGWHPFFNIEKDSRVSFHADQVWLNDQNMLPCKSQPAKAEWDFNNGRPTIDLAVDNCFQGWDGSAILEYPAQRRTVSIAGCDRLTSLVVFRPTDGREFIAIEPVTHVNNGIHLLAQKRPDTGVHILMPHECIEVVTRFQVTSL